ncbi:sn-glycerol-3-phosphate ABC transporter permease UgpA [Pleomorphomonas oryzae]|uniref:sn-glycerol-3-phosphate ABC transporter permease UgpA n=1 Tax=Pleomorphomonas oryzae TaxID=261934 RepID=UPI0004215356|nr:sn-glycerol-3-phosphate ABC transporter permease UgpA [Pleomorphomonas oryzae]
MQTKRTVFGNRLLPYALLLPQLAVTVVFFLWPAAQAVLQSFQREDAFGLSTTWVGLTNYADLLSDPTYLNSLKVTAIFAPAVTLLSVGLGLIFAASLDRLARGSRVYAALLVWPYAVAPAIGGIMWWFLFNPTIGLLPYLLAMVGYRWDHALQPTDAMILVVIAASWKQVSYNFLFFMAGLQAIPKSMIEAAAIDGAGPVKRFFTIVFPLLSPTTFFLAVINLVYAMFDTFPVIHATTGGNPAQSTNILVYKVFVDGFIGLNLGSSAAQSVVLMAIVVALTVIQFKWVERKVTY